MILAITVPAIYLMAAGFGLFSLILTYLFIFDPDYIRRQRAGSIDYWGLGLLVVGFILIWVLT